MGECHFCSLSTSDPHWCDNWRPPPIPVDLPQTYRTEYFRLLNNNTLKLSEQLRKYAEICPFHLSPDEITTGETRTPTVATASFAGWLVLALVIGILVAAVGVFIYYKKKHGRFNLKGPCLKCFSSNGVSWDKLSGKFRRYNSREPESKDIDKENVEFRISYSGEVHVNHALNENHEFLLTNQNGSSNEFQFIDDDSLPENNVMSVYISNANNVTNVSHPKLNDYVNYSPIQTKDSPKKLERLPSELEEIIAVSSETKDIPKTDTTETVLDAPNRKENVSAESIKDPPAEPVKKRKKKFKLRHANKIHSSPAKNNDKEIKIGQDENDKRKTY